MALALAALQLEPQNYWLFKVSFFDDFYDDDGDHDDVDETDVHSTISSSPPLSNKVSTIDSTWEVKNM